MEQYIAQLAQMGKMELRTACKEAGVKNYGKMDNAGMRAALARNEATRLVAATGLQYTEEEFARLVAEMLNKVAPTEPEVGTVIETPTHEAPNKYMMMLGHGIAVSSTPTNGTMVRDGKKVVPKSEQKPTPRTKEERAAAPSVPRVSRKGYTIQKERIVQNGVKKHSEGTVCAQVWDAFDAIMKKNGVVLASELAALADANGWNRTNVSCEYYAWRKFHGIKGRVTKQGAQ